MEENFEVVPAGTVAAIDEFIDSNDNYDFQAEFNYHTDKHEEAANREGAAREKLLSILSQIKWRRHA